MSRFSVTVAVVAALCTVLEGPAQASVIGIGSVLPEKFEVTEFQRVQTFFNTALPEPGATPSSPVNGAIVRWRVQGRKVARSTCECCARTAKAAMKPPVPARVPCRKAKASKPSSTDLKVQAGDLIGLDPTNVTDAIGVADASGASYASIFPTLFDSSVVPASESFSGREIELAAEIQPQPESPRSRPRSARSPAAPW